MTLLQVKFNMTLLAVIFHCTSSVNVQIKNASAKMLHTFVGVNKCCILSQATKCFLVQMTWHLLALPRPLLFFGNAHR